MNSWEMPFIIYADSLKTLCGDKTDCEFMKINVVYWDDKIISWDAFWVIGGIDALCAAQAPTKNIKSP